MRKITSVLMILLLLLAISCSKTENQQTSGTATNSVDDSEILGTELEDTDDTASDEQLDDLDRDLDLNEI